MTNDTAPSIEERRQRLRQVAWPLALLFILIRTALGFWLNVSYAAAANPSAPRLEASSAAVLSVSASVDQLHVKNAAALALETPTIPITGTAELTPTTLIKSDCRKIDNRLNFGGPDGNILSVAPGSCLIIDLPQVLSGDGSPNYDFVFYEAYTSSAGEYISLDWVEFDVSEDGQSWKQLFIWDHNPGSGRNSNIAKYGENGPNETDKIRTIDLYGDPYRTGVLIDLDSAELTGHYHYLRVTRPNGSTEGAQIDAIEEPKTPIPNDHDTPTPTNSPVPTNTPTNTPTVTPTNTPTSTPTSTPTPPIDTPTTTNPATSTPTNTPTPTTKPTNTPTATSTPTNTPTPKPKPTKTPT